ncbi:S8 family serine peptidase [Solihabitans fulvus]|uniref:S8 family serine peptidase n=1 Tax=Solihabitans fulvus TaxID=1892852 RepID=A0A5B2X095_9PSEU|nr:S8 family serine peptidase [Solihabitans fulvus]KAA2256730.1 S8 family serine peptidase [Solihabitans fulvus]
MRVRLVAAALAALVVTGVAATPAIAAPGLPGHPEWWFDAWNVQGLWDGGARGQGIVIAEIDTGINADLPELSGNIGSGADFGASDGDGRTDRDIDESGHGTAMASIMVSHASGPYSILGIAPEARVLPVAVPLVGTTYAVSSRFGDYLEKAIRWSADHDAKIISMSLGSDRDPNITKKSCTSTEQAAIDYAIGKGAIVVAASGNGGDKGSPVTEPGVCLGVISVGAIDQAGAVAPWSSRHPYLTVTAPGVNIPTVGRIAGQLYYGDGTSQATALTSGGLAVLWSKYPQLTSRQVVARLLATLDGAHSTRDPSVGYGTINIGNAVNASVPADAPNPVYDAVDPFLAKEKIAASTPTIKPAADKSELPGGFAVRAAPNTFTSGDGLVGIVVAAIGVLAFAVLAVLARRRRARQTRA